MLGLVAILSAGALVLSFGDLDFFDDDEGDQNDGETPDELDTSPIEGELSNGIGLTEETNGTSITGSNKSDSLVGGPGDDTIYGLAGNDTIIGEAGSEDILYGGEGDDLLIDGEIASTSKYLPSGGGGSEYLSVKSINGGTLFGGNGDDTLFAAVGDAYGGSGNDVLSNYADFLVTGETAGGFSGAGKPPNLSLGDLSPGNSLFGETGDDNVYVVGGNAFGGEGEDTISGHGYDQKEILRNNHYFAVPKLILDGGQGNDHIIGENNIISGGDGDDELWGRNSYIYGGEGDDRITVGLGGGFDGQKTIIEGGAGDDVLLSEYNGPYIPGGEVGAYFSGGSGDDLIDARTYADWIEISGGDGEDSIFAEARNSANAQSENRLFRTTVADYDPSEDMLVVDVPVVMVGETISSNEAVVFETELLDISASEGVATELRITLVKNSGFEFFEHENLDPLARFVVLEGIASDEVDLSLISIRPILNGEAVT